MKAYNEDYNDYLLINDDLVETFSRDDLVETFSRDDLVETFRGGRLTKRFTGKLYNLEDVFRKFKNIGTLPEDLIHISSKGYKKLDIEDWQEILKFI